VSGIIFGLAFVGLLACGYFTGIAHERLRTRRIEIALASLCHANNTLRESLAARIAAERAKFNDAKLGQSWN